MTDRDTPEDGDFSAYLARKAAKTPAEQSPGVDAAQAENATPDAAELRARPQQKLEDVLVHGEHPSDELMEEIAALEGLEALSDAELEDQALRHPGGDGDPRTPE